MLRKHSYTAEALLDSHVRTHVSLRKLLNHCAELSDAELYKKLKGFGYPTVHAQLCHLIQAEEYWIGVVQGSFDARDRDAEFPAVKDLQRYRRAVAKLTADYLRQTSDAALNEPRMMLTYGAKRKKLVPAHVVLRTQTHAFQHQGQILAMCRIMGHPGPRGLDFPLKP